MLPRQFREMFSGGSPRWPRLRQHAARLGIGVALAILTYLLFPSAPATEFPIYEVGSVASDNVIAPFAFRVLQSPADLAHAQETAVQAVEPVYDFAPAALDSARNTLDGFAGAVDEAAGARDPRAAVAAIQRVGTSWGVPLSIGQAQYLDNPTRRSALFGALGRAFDRWLSAGVAAADAMDQVHGAVVIQNNGEDRRMAGDSVMTFSGLVSRARLIHPDPGSAVGDSLYMRLLASFFHPTVVPDRATTELRKAEVRRAVSTAKYDIQAGEKIVGANEVVSREQNEKLRALHDAVEQSRGTRRGARRVIGSVLFDLLLIVVMGITVLLFRPHVYDSFRWLVAVAATVLLVLIGGAIVAHLRPLRPELVPVALAAVLLSALFDQRISMIAAVLIAALVAGQNVFRGTNALFLNLVGAGVAAFSVGPIRRRNQSYRWIVAIGLAYAAAAIAIGLTLDLPSREILVSVGFGLVNAVGSVLLALLLLPMAEAFTGIETDLTLLEWSDLNRPLMQRLSLEAPGTYAHTIAIANLAEAASRAIGANALLARVGAYYHDIGKIARPQYFVENQSKGRNPHDTLDPSTSATIIRNHVREGLELARANKLPRALRAFITEHHGTGAISYFLEKAREHGSSTPPNPTEFAYGGPLPRSAETAVVMLADGVEAATRVLHDPTPEKIHGVVEHIIRQRIEQGQLQEAPLTLKQLDTIREQFTRVLVGMYHNRIDYPAASGGVGAGFAAR